ncbi:valine--tRNA ligase [Candidatus Pacearchaeota archaeon]|nr:valine--tRNA ligase [Candidatus Pacearchaeota archaeon]MBD3283799.1 valine--tRNA ligase [Candidatus Pacearchaeota archaeon]
MSQYNPQEVENRIRKFWDREKIYKFDSKSKKPVYSIDTPPPTVSGKMHIGHAFQYSQMDFIARYKRMRGFNLFYPFGTDDNGLPTERLVERLKGVKAFDLGREEFIKLVLDTLKKELRPRYLEDWKNIGTSCDWELFYSTIDDHTRGISQWSFLDLYKKGRMERRDAPAMWCPECHTGVAQVEIKDKELESNFNDIVFKADGKDLIIATTRPELLPACVAVFYHPDDKRYKDLKGKKARVPLFNFEVPILEDKRADPEKGTGIVMCCTFGDQTDMEWQKAHSLPIKEAITEDGKMTELAEEYKGLSIKEARESIIKDLKKQQLLKKQEKIKHFVNVHERCGTEIEFIKTKQWFVRYLDLKKDMLKWGKQLNWYPKFMKTRYDNWVKGLQWDWLISNQRYYGVPFPLWYCEKCDKVIVADEKDLPVDPLKKIPSEKCECGGEIIPEKDVLNTWFTSSLTPTIAAKLTGMEDLRFMNLRPQAHDIITFWLFNTVVKSNLHYKKNPWKNIMISGFVTLKGKKMSKSKGNIVEPQDVVEVYGADALRFWAAGSKLGEDLDYQEKDLITGKKLLIKLWNATRFVFMNLKDFDSKLLKKEIKLEKTDILFLRKLNSLVKFCTESFDEYEYSRVKNETEKFFWQMFCDNYLEIVKKRIYQNKKGKESAQYVLYRSLLTILKLFAPIMPFITEEIYKNYFEKSEKIKSIHISEWPLCEKEEKSEELDFFVDILTKIRQEKSRAKKSMNSEIILTLSKKERDELADMLEDLKDVTNAREIKEGKFRVEF